MNENVTLDGYFDEAREYIEANAKNEIQTERLNEMIFGLHEEWKHRAKTMDSDKNANETVNFNVQTIHVRNEIVKFAYDTDAIFNFTHRNTQYKPQKISFQALSSEILSPEYLNSGWIEELSPRICQNWKHIISSDCCVDAILNTEGKLLYRIFKDVQYYCQLCNI